MKPSARLVVIAAVIAVVVLLIVLALWVVLLVFLVGVVATVAAWNRSKQEREHGEGTAEATSESFRSRDD